MPLKILIADDDLDDLELLEEALLEARPNCKIDKAMGGKAAITFLGSYTEPALPQLVVLDYNMPEVSGSEVLTYIKGQTRYDNVPRVMFSTSNAERHIAECLKNGATKYFVKPRTKRELDDLASQMLSLIPGE